AAQRLLARDLTPLRTGRVQYALLCNDDGGINDDVLVYAVAEGGYLLVVNAGNQDSDFDWIRSHSPDGAVFNVGREWALVGVQGPGAVALVQRVTSSALGGVKYYAFIEGRVVDMEHRQRFHRSCGHRAGSPARSRQDAGESDDPSSRYSAAWLSGVAGWATGWGGQLGKRLLHARLQHCDGLCASCAYGATNA